ncbi:hypothetical protein AAEX28_00125 [Lentisphaerota bacterium WC36G]|nr:hypothetical protein LJT99_03000 [Lentisphaerae bacterium WC36]
MNNIKESSMANFIYTRVNAENQNLQSQINKLKQYAHDKIMAIDEVLMRFIHQVKAVMNDK